MNLYQDKDKNYFSNIRLDILSLLPVNPQQKILEIGAGSGDTLVYLKKNGLAKEVMGIELFDMPGTNQQNPLIDRFSIANIEDTEILADQEEFDVILCGDVLEHLIDPWAVVEKLTHCLKRNGLLIVSVPNFREMGTLYRIVFKGEFSYDPQGGILDKTHLRFFCKKDILQLLTNQSLKPIYSSPSFLRNGGYGIEKRKRINKLTFGLFKEWLAVQFLVIAKKQ